MAIPIKELPVLRAIFECLDPRSLSRLARVCREFRGQSEKVAEYILRRLSHIVCSADGLELSRQDSLFTYTHHLYHITTKRIILIGGGSMDEGQESYKRSDRLNIVTGEWSSCSSMMKKRGTFKTEAVAVGNFAVAVSGDDEAAVGTLEAYSPFTDSWIDLPPLPEKLMLVAAAAINEILYISGGIDKATGLYSGLIYCLNMGHRQFGEWTTLPASLLKPRVGHASATLDGRLWVAGGQFSGVNAVLGSTEYVSSTSVELYDFQAQCWTLGPSMLAERIWFRLLVVGGSLYAVGGDVDSKGRSLIPTIERLDVVRSRWEKVGEFRDVRRVFSTTAVDNKIYVFGGRDVNYGTLQDWDCFDCTVNEWESARYDQLSDDDKKKIDRRVVPPAPAGSPSPSSSRSVKSSPTTMCIKTCGSVCMNTCGSASTDSADSSISPCLSVRSPEERQIPRAKFYGGQSIALPAEDITWS